MQTKPRGYRMKISGSPAPAAPLAPAAADPAPAAQAAAPAAPALQSAALQQAQTRLAEMPEIDQAKVTALRDALARGELPFDAGKLAGLIDRYHGGKS
jgi:negative regulator of flagellin synthesis FlgM